jgi:hypothetical protein
MMTKMILKTRKLMMRLKAMMKMMTKRKLKLENQE